MVKKDVNGEFSNLFIRLSQSFFGKTTVHLIFLDGWLAQQKEVLVPTMVSKASDWVLWVLNIFTEKENYLVYETRQKLKKGGTPTNKLLHFTSSLISSRLNDYLAVYLVRNFSWLVLAQYSCHINLNRKMWNTKIRNPMENQKIAGRPPNLLPCLWSAITWCSCAGAESK